MRVRVIAAALILWLVALGAAEPGLSLFAPAMAPGALEDLETTGPLTQYQLWLEVSFAQSEPRISGHQQLHYVNNEGVPLHELYLRLYPNGDSIYGLGSLEISNVSVNQEPVIPQLELGRTAVRLPLAEPLPPEARLMVELDFSGLVPEDFSSSNGSSYGIYDYTQGALKLANWFPILAGYDQRGWHLDPVYGWGDAVYSETALFEVWITAPSEQIVVASGTEIDWIANPGGTITHHYISGPMRDFFVGMSKDFQKLSAEVGQTVVNSYYLVDHKTGGEIALGVATEAVALFNRRFGLYPFAELDVLEAPLNGAGGVEYPGLILIGSEYYASPRYWGDSLWFFAMIVSHETAHQWWYSLVGNDVIGEPWLDEALVTYASGIYVKELLSETDYEELLDHWLSNYRRAESQVDLPITTSLDQFPDGYGYYGIVYCGGALFYRELRAELGDELFFAALSEYFRRFKYGVATTEGLLRIFEEVSGKGLGELYGRWLFAPASSLAPPQANQTGVIATMRPLRATEE